MQYQAFFHPKDGRIRQKVKENEREVGQKIILGFFRG
jgi:hypothetical protein